MAESQSNVKRLFGQSAHYVLGTLLSTFAHFFTFPIFTRIFSVSEYGILSLITVTISTVLAFSKFGLTNSSVRMYEECLKGKNNISLANYYSTFFLTAIISAGTISILYGILTPSLSGVLFDRTQTTLFVFASFIIFARTVNAILLSFKRAEQETKFYNTVSVVLTYSSSLLSILLVLFFIKGLWGFYTAQFIVEAVTLFGLGFHLLKKYPISFSDFSFPLLEVGMKFGIPLVGLEFLNHILTYGDRFLIKLYCGSESLGLYSVGYNLSIYVSNLLLVPISFAIMPVLMQAWVRDGKKATQQFMSDAIRYFALLFFPVIIGLIAINKELIVVLASEKYLQSANIVPVIAIGVGFFAASNLFNAGLIIYKRTGKILLYSLASALLNMVLNLMFIPKFGMLGAAYATLLAYFFFFIAVTINAYILLPYDFMYTKIMLYLLIAILMALTLFSFKIENMLLSLFAKVIVGIIFYVFFVLLADFDLRLNILKFWNKKNPDCLI